MKKGTIQKKTDKELLKLLKEKRADLQSFRFGSAGSKAKNTKKGNTDKKDIARILTELSARKKQVA